MVTMLFSFFKSRCVVKWTVSRLVFCPKAPVWAFEEKYCTVRLSETNQMTHLLCVLLFIYKVPGAEKKGSSQTCRESQRLVTAEWWWPTATTSAYRWEGATMYVHMEWNNTAVVHDTLHSKGALWWNRFQVFSNDGQFKMRFGVRGRSPGQLQRPTGVTVDMNGDIVVADYDNRWVSIFSSDGKFKVSSHSL